MPVTSTPAPRRRRAGLQHGRRVTAGAVLADLRSPALAEPRRLVAVPLGSCEQHGPHLPLGTDTVIATALAARLADWLPDVVVAPAVGISASGEHAELPRHAVDRHGQPPPPCSSSSPARPTGRPGSSSSTAMAATPTPSRRAVDDDPRRGAQRVGVVAADPGR